MAARTTLLTRFADLIWVGVPLVMRRFSAGLAVATVDGLYLAVRPVVGLLVPLAAVAAGLLVGAFHPGFDLVFTEALWLLLLVAAVGTASGAVGLYLTLGFVLGDVFLGDHGSWPKFESPLVRSAALALTYALFAMLAVGTPIAAKSLASELRLPSAVPRAVRAVVGVVVLVGVSGLLAFGWSQSAPLLVRPMFTWAGQQPTVPSISPLQDGAKWIVIAAIIASAGRMAIQLRLARSIGAGEPASDRMTALEDRFRTPEPVKPLLSRVPLVVRLLLRTAVLTGMLAGLYASYVQAGVTFAVLFVAQLLSSPLLPLDLGAYARFMAKVPRLVRLLVALLPVYLLGNVMMRAFRNRSSFVPFLLVAVVSAAIMALLNPVPRRRVSP